MVRSTSTLKSNSVVTFENVIPQVPMHSEPLMALSGRNQKGSDETFHLDGFNVM